MGRNLNDERLKPDERNWEYWSTPQFIEWVKYNFRDRCDDVDGDTMDHLLEAIRSQRIQGATLAHLEVEDLRCIGLSFGDSMMLFHDICDLIHNYPSRSRHWDTRRSRDHIYNNRREDNRDSTNTGIDLDAWLGKKIGQTKVVTEEEEDDEDDVEENMRAQVYDPREETATIQKSSNEHASARLPSTDGTGSSAGPAFAKGTFGNVQLDEELLKAMPPNIREIAARRPDLVQALMASRSDNDSRIPNDAGPFLKTDKSLELRNRDDKNEMEHDLYSVEEENDESGGWFSGESNSHEMLGLLRRRGKTE